MRTVALAERNVEGRARGVQLLRLCHQQTLFIVLLSPAVCPGESVCENLSAMGVKLVTSNTEAEMRLCTSLVDERFGETTEIIEPWSAEVRCGSRLRVRARRLLLVYGSLPFVLCSCSLSLAGTIVATLPLPSLASHQLSLTSFPLSLCFADVLMC